MAGFDGYVAAKVSGQFINQIRMRPFEILGVSAGASFSLIIRVSRPITRLFTMANYFGGIFRSEELAAGCCCLIATILTMCPVRVCIGPYTT